MRNTLTTAAILLLALVSFNVSSQESESSDEITPSAQPIEEISVIGQRTLSRLHLRIAEKEDDMYAFELEEFFQLMQMEKTQARIKHTLSTGKPLVN